MQTSKPYRLAKIQDSNPNDWLVYFFYRNPETGKMQRFKNKVGLNNKNLIREMAAAHRTSEEEMRRMMAIELQNVINEELKNGYNPFETINEAAETPAHKAIHPIGQTMQKYLEDLCKISSQNKKETYRLMFGRFIKYMAFANLTDRDIEEVDVETVENFQEFLMYEMKLACKTINSTISHVGHLFAMAVKKKMAKSNPFREVTPLKPSQFRGMEKDNENDDVFEPLTPDELTSMIGAFEKMKQQGFIRFLAFIYYAWIRPIEISKLRVRDIDMKRGLVRLKSHSTKNDRSAFVQIVPPLAKLLKPLELENQPPDHFLFSDKFMPGTKPVHPYDDCTVFWKETADKLGITKKMYALKHTGNIEYILQNKGNVDIKWQQMQNRHASPTQTETYNRKLGIYIVDTETMKFGEFSGQKK